MFWCIKQVNAALVKPVGSCIKFFVAPENGQCNGGVTCVGRH